MNTTWWPTHDSNPSSLIWNLPHGPLHCMSFCARNCTNCHEREYGNIASKWLGWGMNEWVNEYMNEKMIQWNDRMKEYKFVKNSVFTFCTYLLFPYCFYGRTVIHPTSCSLPSAWKMIRYVLNYLWRGFSLTLSLAQVTKIEFLLSNINTMSSRQVMRIEKNINHGMISWFNAKFSELTS